MSLADGNCTPRTHNESAVADFEVGVLEAQPGFEPGMEVLQTSALPLGYCAACEVLKTVGRAQEGKSGAGNGIRTRDFDLGKVALYH